MTIYVRNKENRTLVDIEVTSNKDYTCKDVSADVIIDKYSELLLNASKEKQAYIVENFTNFSDLRGWYWEVFNSDGENPTTKETIDAIMEILKPVCVELELAIITD